MLIDALVFEIGSTTTVVNAFDQIYTDHPQFIGQGIAYTTVLEGDVTLGLQKAMEDLKQKKGIAELTAKETFATSSAAGGLKMSVHGLVYDMTVKAAKEACLGAGANLVMVTSGRLLNHDIKKIQSSNLNIIMISGGVDYGETATQLYNAEKIASLQLNIPVIYAGNIQIQDEIKDIFLKFNQEQYLTITDNVYPKIDSLNVESTRKIIQSIFEKHIIHAPGMEKIDLIVNQGIIPTPGAVMEATILLGNKFQDLVTLDIGGATTDVHSFTQGNEALSKMIISVEPTAKRTVEGDLGVYINQQNIIRQVGEEKVCEDLKISASDLHILQEILKPIPDEITINYVEYLASKALDIAISRHAGRYITLYSSAGKQTFAEGKDLTKISCVIATGGALTRLRNPKKMIQELFLSKSLNQLLPKSPVHVFVDHDYIMASIGVLSLKYKESALKLLLQSLDEGEPHVS